MSLLQKGMPAPDFSLRSAPDQWVSLSDFRGRRVILVFYPADWSPVCGDQLALYNQILPMFKRHNADVLGISVDGPWCHTAYRRDRRLNFALLADFEPKGEVSRLYRAYHYKAGESERALYLVDEDGVIQWSYLSPMGINPGADGILDALESLPVKEAA